MDICAALHLHGVVVIGTSFGGLLAMGLEAPCPSLIAVAQVPLLLVRGEVSDSLLPSTVAHMQAEGPDMTVVTLPEIGHAPILTEPPALALQTFLEQIR